jgi:broad specificity phosphatase PhoE
MGMELHLVRHGHHPDGFRGGWSQHGLTELGRAQAAALARRLAAEGFTVDTLLTSDLPRARETAEIIAPALGLPVRLAPEWRETNNGALAGMENEEAERRYPGLYWSTLAMEERYPGGGESPALFRDRIHWALESLQRKVVSGEVGPRVMVVTHGGVIRVVAALVRGIAWSNRLKAFPAEVTSIHSFRFADGVWQVLRENDHAHLNAR